jgi:hypothetical protein
MHARTDDRAPNRAVCAAFPHQDQGVAQFAAGSSPRPGGTVGAVADAHRLGIALTPACGCNTTPQAVARCPVVTCTSLIGGRRGDRNGFGRHKGTAAPFGSTAPRAISA